jgi:hypothetical protein
VPLPTAPTDVCGCAYQPAGRWQAPAGAGVGLEFHYHSRFPDPSWPADWWQRNYDLPIVDPDSPDPMPLTDRMMQIPPAPVTP